MVTRLRLAAACALAALAAAFVYGGTLGHGFVWDDHIYIEQSPFVLDPSNIRTFLEPGFWTGRLKVDDGARPVVLASYLADRALWGSNPGGYHLTNLLLHSAASAAVVLVAAAATASPAAAGLAGLLFALHPVQSEAVCEVTFRADLLAALLVLLALIARRRAAGRGAPSWAAWSAASAASFALALLAKENAAVFLALAWLEDRLAPAPAPRRRALAQWALFAVVVGAYAAFRLPHGAYPALAPVNYRETTEEWKHTPPPTTPSVHLTPSPQPWAQKFRAPVTRTLTMLGVFSEDVRLVLWPAGLQADRTSPILESWLSPRAWAGLTAILALFAAAWGLRRRLPAASFGILWFMVALTPVSGVVALYNLSAERYLYLPVAGAAIAAAALLEAASRRARRPRLALAAAAAAILVPAAAATVRRVPAWSSDGTLFGGALVTDGARLRYNRGLIARQNGNLDEAESEYRRALAFNPNYVEALVNLSEVERAKGRDAEELRLLKLAVAIKPPSAVAREALGSAYARRGLKDLAFEAFEHAVGVDSRSTSARTYYAAALANAGKKDEADAQAQIAANLEPKSPETQYAVGLVEQRAGRWANAAAAFRKAAAAQPDNGLAWANLGVSLYHSGDVHGALGPLLKAKELLPNHGEIRHDLGSVENELGRAKAAQADYAAAAKLEPKSALFWHDYGVVMQKAGKTGDAEVAYSTALRIDPDRVESLFNFAGLRAAAGDYGSALALIRHARELRPGDPVVSGAADAIARAAAAAGKGK